MRWHLNRKKIEKIKLDIRERYAKIITDVKNTIKAILAEKVDFDRKIAVSYTHLSAVGVLLRGIIEDKN